MVHAIPLLTKEGWPRHQANARSHIAGADGVVAHKKHFGVSDHPSCAFSAASPPL